MLDVDVFVSNMLFVYWSSLNGWLLSPLHKSPAHGYGLFLGVSSIATFSSGVFCWNVDTYGVCVCFHLGVPMSA